MESSTPLISILIVNYNGLKHLPECLESLQAQTFKDFEVVLVDNGSKDGSLDWVERHHPEVRRVPSDRNLGFAGGNNFGYPHCRGRYIYFLNNDVKAEPDAVQALASAIGANPGINVFASLLINYREPDKVDSAGDSVYTCGKGFSFTHYPVSLFTSPRLITSACAGAALYARTVLEKIGLFDEDFFLNYEDLDLSFRAQHAGEKILFIPASRILHKGSSTLGGKKSALSLYYAERNFGQFVFKNFPMPYLLKFIPSILFVKAWGLFAALWFRVPGAYVRGNLSFLGQLPRLPAKRRRILETSVLTSRDFEKLLRRGWLREKIAFLRGRYRVP
ncbi:MAG TPA: glycosyltransferase family 2 protein [Fibrobacteria bacterium]|nr:glycosyltransferase family 2 protein [Fibrobacteria bacterium]